ncbi:MAG: metallophosphoesterase family protein [Quinella sp. 2Q5]|nr:metallophosphoesterase family protein [Quinella sp. 2Q5]
MAAVGVGSFFTAGCMYEEITLNRPNIKFLRQIVTADLSTSRCLMFNAAASLISPAVQIRAADGTTKFIPAQETTFTDDGARTLQYTAQINGLNADEAYEFQITDGDATTDWHVLKGAASDKFTAIIFPDSQCGTDYETWGNVARAAFERTPDAKFFVNVGDLVDNGEDHAQWEDWFRRVENFLPTIPFAPVMGNHETYTRDWKVRQPLAYLNYFAPPDNGHEDFARRFYSFDCGAAHFAVLDSQWQELGADIISVQRDWLRQDFAATDKPWKIVFIHKDVLQYRINGRPERLEGFSDVGEQFMPVFESLGADVVFTGHLHTYRNRGRLKNFQPDEEGPLYVLTGLSGNVRYEGLWIDHALDKFVAPQPETDNYLTLEVDAKTLTVRCFLPSGEQLDETTLHKS